MACARARASWSGLGLIITRRRAGAQAAREEGPDISTSYTVATLSDYSLYR